MGGGVNSSNTPLKSMLKHFKEGFMEKNGSLTFVWETRHSMK